MLRCIIQLYDLSSKPIFHENTKSYHLSSSPAINHQTGNISSSSLEYSASSGARYFAVKHILPESGDRNLTAPNSTRTKFPNANQECEQLRESDNMNCKARTCHIFITNTDRTKSIFFNSRDQHLNETSHLPTPSPE